MTRRSETSRRHRAGGRREFAASLAAALLLLAGCRSEMYEQPRYEPLEPSSFFEDGKSSRPLVAGTVPREDVRGAPPQGADEDVFYTGWDKGRLAETVPFPLDRAQLEALLERGQERYRIYCVPCHAESGDGRGMIVRRGFNPPPPYYSAGAAQAADRPLLRRHDPRLRHHVFLREPDPAARPLGHRGVYPRAPAQPACAGLRAAARRIARNSPTELARTRAGGPSHERRPRGEHARRTVARAWTASRGCRSSSGVAGLAVSAAGCLFWPGSFFHAYLVGYVFWVGITLGCLGLTMLHHLVGGGWGLPIRRPMESAGVTLLPLAIFFLPIALNLPRLYEWAVPEVVEKDAVLQAKSTYLNDRLLPGPHRRLLRRLDRPGTLARPAVRRAGPPRRSRAESMAGLDGRPGADPPVPDGLVRGDRLDDDARAALGLVDLRRHGGRRPGSGHAGDAGRDRRADVRPPADGPRRSRPDGCTTWAT